MHRYTLLLMLAVITLAACKGRSPNYVRKDLPFASEPWGPDKLADHGFAHAFDDTLLQIVTVDDRKLVVHTWREDGRDDGERVIIEVDDTLWDVSDERLETDLGKHALGYEQHANITTCLAEGPKKEKRALMLFERGLLRIEDGWALSFTARLTLQCQTPAKVKKRKAYLDYVVLLDDDFAPTSDPELLRYGAEPKTQVLMYLDDELTIGWATAEHAGFTRSSKLCPLSVKDGALDNGVKFIPTDTGVAVITHNHKGLRVRILEDSPAEPLVDLTVDPGLGVLSYTGVWAGDRLGLFFAIDKTEGTGTILQHVLIEFFPDGTVSDPMKVYTQYSISEDPAFTRKLTGVFTDGVYGLTWIADDGYNQDIVLQEVPLGGIIEQAEKSTWHLDLGDGYRATRSIALFATAPQYVLVHVTAMAHNITLTALPTQR